MSEALAGDCVVAVTRSQQTPRSSARRKLLAAFTHAAGSEGYSDLTVERVLEVAGVSRASFYQYFSNLDDCFTDAYRQQAEVLSKEMARALGSGERGEFALIDALTHICRRDPDAARLLAVEGIAAGPVGLRVRDELVASIQRAISVSRANEQYIDLPVSVLIGAALRFVAMRLTASDGTDTTLDESRAWMTAFARRGRRHGGWSARLAPAAKATTVSRRAANPQRLRGSARQRLLAAAAATVREKGYRSVAVSDIVTAAGVSRRSFYNEFDNKSDVVIAAAEHTFGRLLEVCTPAFFSPGTWAARVWKSALAFTAFFTSQPSFAHLGFVDCYAIGRGFVRRAHDMQLAFTLFLEEGYRQRGEGREPSRLCSEMTAAAMMEIGFQSARSPDEQSIRRLQPLAVYIVLTPFIGSDDAAEFVLGSL